MRADTPKSDIEKLIDRFERLDAKVAELATPRGSEANRTVQTLAGLVTNIQAQLNDYIANGTYNKAQIDAGFATKTHTHAASDITSGGTTATGFGVGGPLTVQGDITGGGIGIFPTGVRSTGARNNQVTNGYVAAYLDVNGNLGFAPSTRESKNIHGPFEVDMKKWLALPLYRFTYKDDPTAREVVGPLADDLDAAGLKEFVVYDEDDGSIQGIRTETLIVGLWSAYLQSRAQTQARIAGMKFQTATTTGMTALGLNSEKTYDIVWPEPFVDELYQVVPSVVTTTGLALAAVANVVPGSQTKTGCKVSVRTLGLALASGATLSVQGQHN